MSLPNEKPAATAPYPNVYLVGLELRDVRCFEGSHELDLSNKSNGPARWTLILGENGVGKTTLLELLEALRPAPLERLNARPPMNVAAMLQLSGIANAFYAFGRAESPRWSFKMKVTHAESLSSELAKDREDHLEALFDTFRIAECFPDLPSGVKAKASDDLTRALSDEGEYAAMKRAAVRAWRARLAANQPMDEP